MPPLNQIFEEYIPINTTDRLIESPRPAKKVVRIFADVRVYPISVIASEAEGLGSGRDDEVSLGQGN